MRQIPRELFGALLVLTIALGGVVVAERFVPQSLDSYADAVVRACADAPHRPSCYDQEIPRLTDRGLSMEEAFEVTAIVQERVGDYYYCHVLGHELAAQETAKDPAQWTTVIARCPSGMCSNGCLHGAAQERFRAESLSQEDALALIPELSGICERTRDYTELERASCYHSLGHLTMYLTGADIDTATDICETIATNNGRKDYASTCYAGAYMQIFQPLEPEDVALVKNIPVATVVQAQAYCDQFTGSRRNACHYESWPRYGPELFTAANLTSFCMRAPGSYPGECFNAVFYAAAAQFSFESDRIAALCEEFTGNRKAQCFANSASRLLETDYRLIGESTELCERAEQQGVGARCWDELLFYSSFNFHPDSQEFTTLCVALPEPWRAQCFEGTWPRRYPNENDG